MKRLFALVLLLIFSSSAFAQPAYRSPFIRLSTGDWYADNARGKIFGFFNAFLEFALTVLAFFLLIKLFKKMTLGIWFYCFLVLFIPLFN